jgi:hypothetical protein
MNTRRQTLKQLALLGLASTLARTASAEDPHLMPNEAKAKELAYTEDASKVDAKKYPAFAQGQSCENCLQLQGKEGAAYRPCALFPGKLVAVKGWCSGWTAEI